MEEWWYFKHWQYRDSNFFNQNALLSGQRIRKYTKFFSLWKDSVPKMKHETKDYKDGGLKNAYVSYKMVDFTMAVLMSGNTIAFNNNVTWVKI